MATARSSADLRRRLGHPVIDCDGHMIEFPAPLEDYVRKVGGSDYVLHLDPDPYRRMSGELEARRARFRGPQTVWWLTPTRNALDRATCALPRLLYERMEEMGLDHAILFSSFGAMRVEHARRPVPPDALEPQRVLMRAFNAYRADLLRPYADRLTPVAHLTMQTPRDAMEDLEYCVRELGYKVASIRSVLRPIEAVRSRDPELYPELPMWSTVGRWLDCFGLDSAHDYDPFWARCVELGVPLMSHGHSHGFTSRSTGNLVYNHIGHFADAGEALCKALFLGGVTHRFPGLRVALLEGGAATGCRVYADLISRWHKRSASGLGAYDPANLDRERFHALHEQYAEPVLRPWLHRLFQTSLGVEPDPVPSYAAIDDFAACGIERPEDIREQFTRAFFFGCEADDPLNALAFRPELLPLGARVRAVFSSDIGHWDVPDMSSILLEAHELVERGVMSAEDFRDFAFVHPVELFTGMNPEFFRGTAVEADVERLRLDR